MTDSSIENLNFWRRTTKILIDTSRVTMFVGKATKWIGLGGAAIGGTERAIRGDIDGAVRNIGIFGAIALWGKVTERISCTNLRELQLEHNLTDAELSRRADVNYHVVAYGDAAPLMLEAFGIQTEQIERPDTQAE